MPTRTGTASQVDGSGGNGSTSVTVPADATMAVAFWCFFDGGGGSFLDTLTLGGNAFSGGSQDNDGSNGTNSCGVGVSSLTTLPGTGSQTLAWTWSAGGARSEGGLIIVVWVKDHNTSTPARDADCNSSGGAATVSVTIDSQPTDLIVAMGQAFTPTNPDTTGTAFISNVTLNSEIYDATEVTPEGGSSTTVTTLNDFPAVAAISLPVAAGGAQNQLSWIRA